jgi:DNA-binding PadR family transcriptional regulator
METLTPTAKVILGVLWMRPRSGYEIKAMVDRSTRFFWAASYGQIYPELKQLAEAGLVAGSEEPTGGRRRTVYQLTPAGEEELRSWLSTPPETLEMRHEGMLKVFFSDALPPAERAARLRDMRDQHSHKAELLRAVEEGVEDRDSSAYTILRFGIEFNAWAAAWCDRAATDLAAPAGAGGRG